MKLLPFSFGRLRSGNILVVNQGGEYVILKPYEFNALINAGRDDVPSDLLPILLSKHLITETEANDVELNLLATKLRTRKSFLREFSSLHMMVLTARCNCFCDYCHASSIDVSATDADMTFEIAKAAIDLIFQSPSHDIKIEFQGGEPLLNWDVLVNSVLYAEEKNKENDNRCNGFVVCTNLMLMDEEKLLFCKEHNVAISTSFDGDSRFHDLHRKVRSGGSSHAVFLEKLHLARELLGHDCANALLTITKDHIGHLKEIIDAYVSNGFNGVFLRAINPYGYAVSNKHDVSYQPKTFVENFKEALRYIISLNISGTYFVEYYTALLAQRILTPFPTGFVDLQSPAGAGISGVIYDYNGEVYPADEGRMLARMNDKRFLMGHVLKNTFTDIFNGDIIKELVRNSCVENMTACATCVFHLYCGADPIRYYVESGDISGRRPNSGFCIKNKAILEFIFELIEENDTQTMDVLWSWATKQSLKEVSIENY